MAIKHTKLHPSELPSLKQDCIWFLKQCDENSPGFIQLNWNMCGSLHRALKQNGDSRERCLIPTMKRVSSDYIMLDAKFSAKELSHTSTGMKFNTVAIVCRDEEKAKKILAELNAQKEMEYPKTILVCAEECGSL